MYRLKRRLTEADLRLFPTIIRFDAVYASLFKCGRKRIRDFPNLDAWMRDTWQLPLPAGGLQIRDTIDIDAARRSYYTNLFPLNPGSLQCGLAYGLYELATEQCVIGSELQAHQAPYSCVSAACSLQRCLLSAYRQLHISTSDRLQRLHCRSHRAGRPNSSGPAAGSPCGPRTF